ncbi:MAG: hypothetical protein GXP62_11310, partial [Oligoflexia bacterium]|nr:hypothetical protein [Oligoflexia bacterium]
MLLWLLGCVAITARSTLPVTLTNVPPGTAVRGDGVAVGAEGGDAVLSVPRPKARPSPGSEIAVAGQDPVRVMKLSDRYLSLTEPGACVRSLRLTPTMPLDRSLLFGSELLFPPAFVVDLLVVAFSEDRKMARWRPRTVDTQSLPCLESLPATTSIHIDPFREGGKTYVFGVT